MPALRRRYHKLHLLAQPYPWQDGAVDSEGCWPPKSSPMSRKKLMSSSDRLWLCWAYSTPWLGAYAVGALWQRWRLLYSLGLIAVSYTLVEGVAMALGAD